MEIRNIRVSNIVIAVFAILLALLSIWGNFIVYKTGMPLTAYTTSGIIQFSFVNTAPTINSFSPTDTTPEVNENSTLGFSVNASDPENDSLNYSWKLDGAQVSTTTTFTYSPGFSDSGAHAVNVTVSDGSLSAAQGWNVTVSDVVYCGDNVCNNSEPCSCADCTSAGRCAEAPASGGGGGGGGGGEIIIKKPEVRPELSIDRELIKVLVKQGETFEQQITVKNTGEGAERFSVSVHKIEHIVNVDKPYFELKPGESETLSVAVGGAYGILPSIYSGSIVIEAGLFRKVIPVIAEIESEKVWFDVSLSMLTREVVAGNSASAQITIFNIARLKEVEVEVFYSIMDLEGNVIFEDSEVMSVETQASFIKKLKTPVYLAPGDYIFAVAAKYEDSIGTASEMFEVIKEQAVEKPFFVINYMIIAILVLTVVMIWVMFFLIFQQRKKLDGIERDHPELLSRIKKRFEKSKEKYKKRIQKSKEKRRVSKILDNHGKKFKK